MPEPSFAVVFGAYLKAARDFRGLTQGELGKASGVSQTTISALEKGGGGEKRKQKRSARAEHIDWLLDALGIPVKAMCARMSTIAGEMEKAEIEAVPVHVRAVPISANGARGVVRERAAAEKFQAEISEETGKKKRRKPSPRKLEQLEQPHATPPGHPSRRS